MLTKYIKYFAFGVMLYFIFEFINHIQPAPYMDEIFHVPQAQKFHLFNFTYWDNKITTFPGLYMFSLIYASILKHILYGSTYAFATIWYLRSINVIIEFINFILLNSIVYDLMANMRSAMNFIISYNLTTFPLLFFYSFFYYTDNIALFFVLLSLRLYVSQIFTSSTSHKYKGFLLISNYLAIFMRQTNVIWVFFLLLIDVQHILFNKLDFKYIKKVGKINSYIFFKYLFWQLYKQQYLWKNHTFTPYDIILFIFSILQATYCFILPIITFCLWVLYNGSIVVGDKHAHKACLNIPQIFYFALFTVTFSPSIVIQFVSSLFYKIKDKKIFLLWLNLIFNVTTISQFLAFCGIAFITVLKFTHVHIYLVSDNRHIVFYVWRYLFDSPYIPYSRYFLIPVYYLCFQLLFNYDADVVPSLTRGSKDDKRAVEGSFTVTPYDPLICFAKIPFILCTCLVLIPQGLLEFRYFITPFIIYRLLHLHALSLEYKCNLKSVETLEKLSFKTHFLNTFNYGVIFEILYYVAINSAMIWLFCCGKPIYWADQPGIRQRIVW